MPQLGTIGKWLTAIEAHKSTSVRVLLIQVSGTPQWGEICIICPISTLLEMIDPFRFKLKIDSGNYLVLTKMVQIRNLNLKERSIYVKEIVKWPHELMLASYTKDRVTYNQLNRSQWIEGFCRIMKEDSCQVTRDHMSDDLISLLDDSNDFSWQAAKASHDVLICQMRQGEATSWSQTDKIDWF